MKCFKWPPTKDEAVALIPRDHPNVVRVVGQILEHGRAGQACFRRGRFIEAKFHRDCCALLIWRLAVDGITADGQVRWDSAKYETRLPGRLSSEEARSIRESLAFADRAQSALENHVACDHIVPRKCVAETLVRPHWWDPDDLESGRDFVITHAEVAIISPFEDKRLDDAKLRSKMPTDWWNASLKDKAALRFSRYRSDGVNIVVTATGEDQAHS
ncbi:MAG TPA: hypothetical protein PKA58_19050 [Polyangium sp.]|nr:hypothetical protein [Polyangium sp.]